MTAMFFLPGAGGSADFWRPVSDRLAPDRERRFFAWPGLGNEPLDPAIRGIDDLVGMVLDALARPVDLIAQSMGGLVALKAALTAPTKIRRLVLTAGSAGVPIGDLGVADWRPDYYRDFPRAAFWISEVQDDLSPRLASLTMPCLLLWGDADAISPPAVGQRLQALLPHSRLHIIKGGGHDLARTHPAEVAALIERHLS